MGFDTDIKADGRVGVISVAEGEETLGILTYGTLQGSPEPISKRGDH